MGDMCVCSYGMMCIVLVHGACSWMCVCVCGVKCVWTRDRYSMAIPMQPPPQCGCSPVPNHTGSLELNSRVVLCLLSF